MDRRSLKFVLDACNGDWITGMPDGVVTRVCTDSRRVAAGDLFFALRGERFDAHDYLDEVVWRETFTEALPVLRPPARDECYGFFPALPLGGPGTADTLQRVKLREHLALLAQLLR